MSIASPSSQVDDCICHPGQTSGRGAMSCTYDCLRPPASVAGSPLAASTGPVGSSWQSDRDRSRASTAAAVSRGAIQACTPGVAAGMATSAGRASARQPGPSSPSTRTLKRWGVAASSTNLATTSSTVACISGPWKQESVWPSAESDAGESPCQAG